MTDQARRRQWGQAVKKRRLELEMTQFALALATGVQQGTISKLELGRINNPTDDLRVAVAAALKSEVSDLFRYPRLADDEVAS